MIEKVPSVDEGADGRVMELPRWKSSGGGRMWLSSEA